MVVSIADRDNYRSRLGAKYKVLSCIIAYSLGYFYYSYYITQEEDRFQVANDSTVN